MRWSLDALTEALEPVQGRLLLADDADRTELFVEGVSIDSRDVAAGDLFVPIVAERDGHDFIASAIAAGAVAFLVQANLSVNAVDVHDPDRSPIPAIEVSDTGEALLELGRAARRRLDATVVGITGSVGKTSVKDLLSAIGAAHSVTHASRASFNNELGVPLTLLSAPEDAGLVIVEMGARNVGHIELLCSVAAPDVGVVTAVAAVHTQIFGSIEQVALAKGELIESLAADGAAVLNADDPLVAAMARRSGTERVITFGRSTGDVRYGEVHTGLDLHPAFTLQTPVGSSRIRLGVAGAHMADNAAAAAAAAIAAGIPMSAIVEGLTSPIMSPHRMEILTTESGATVINDSYNANPTSMRAAMTALLAVPAQRRIAVLGVMAELGPREVDDHRSIADEMCDAGVEVVAVAAPLYGEGVEHVADIAGAERMVGELAQNDAVLVKGSRVAGLDVLALRLVAAERSR